MDKEKMKLAREKAKKEQLIRQQQQAVRTFRKPAKGEIFYQDAQAKYRDERSVSGNFLAAVKSLAAYRDQSSSSERIRKNGQREGLILTGTVSGAKSTEEYGICAEILLGKHNEQQQIILIPFASFTTITDEQLEARRIGKKRYLSNRAGSQVDFMVTEDIIVGGKRMFLGDRITAMLVRKHEMWFSEIRETNAEKFGTYRFNRGDVIQARVTMVTKNAMTVEAFGIEKGLLAKDVLTGIDRGKDVREFYRAGDVINVMITSIEREQTARGEDVQVKLSAAACRKDMNSELFDFISIGDEFEGVIGKISDGRRRGKDGKEILAKPYVLVNLLNGCTVYIPSIPEYAIMTGDRCRVSIKKKLVDKNTGARLLHGTIQHTY